jgi:replicative DNA helicase
MMAYTEAEHPHNAIPTGFTELDEYMCGGLCAPELIIAGARPGKGKSAFLMAAAMNAARNGKHIGYFSLEMSPVQNGQRALSSTSLVGIGKQRKGPAALTEQDWAAMSAGLERLHDDMDGRFRMYRGYKLTFEKIEMLARHARERGELDMLVIDYLQLLRTAEKTTNDVERLGYVSKGLKQLALELNIPILTASQIRRQGAEETRRKGGRAPTLDELRGSGDLEQDADTVLLIHSPEDPEDATLKHLPEKHLGIFERAQTAFAQAFTVEIAKQRQGPLGRTWCLFKPMNMRFFDDTR